MLKILHVVSNFKHRKALSKLRVSDHKLNIEVGRHTKLSLSERICTFCNVVIEDEKHFLLECTVYIYENLRKTLFDDIVTDLPYYQEATTMINLKSCLIRAAEWLYMSLDLYIMLLN